MRTLEQAAAEIARQSYREVTTEPEAYGITRPWRSVQEWINFELDGAGPEELVREFRVSFSTAADALTKEMKTFSLRDLNAGRPVD